MGSERAIVVHPLFLHTLPKDTPRPPPQWDSLPAAILHKLASALTSAQELVTFEVLNRTCWYAFCSDSLADIVLTECRHAVHATSTRLHPLRA